LKLSSSQQNADQLAALRAENDALRVRLDVERQVLQSQKLTAIARLGGDLAHNINNMLMVVLWNLELIGRALAGNAKEQARVEIATAGALNCTELVRKLLAFSSSTPHQSEPIDLEQVIPRVWQLIDRMVGGAVSTDYTLPPGLWPILADPTQIELALLNLAVMARDSLPDGGTLALECANVESDDIGLAIAPGDYVTIAVTDSGREPGKDLGLGLSMVEDFVAQSGGQMVIESAPSAGTTVRLYLPKAEIVGAAAKPGSGIAALPQDGQIILVVEDDADVRCIAQAQLQEMGYKVLAAENAGAALRILATDQPINILFTDVVMPDGMDGIALARHAALLRPGIKVLLTSGHSPTHCRIGGVPEGFLPKPYREEELQQALGAVILTPAATVIQSPPLF
jgi:CheY-like chemotaxis protein